MGRISWAGAGSSPSLVGILCCAGSPGQIPSAPPSSTQGLAQGCDHLKMQLMKSVPALYLSVELLISKVMQLQKTPKCGILAPSELSQTIPLIFLHHNGGSPSSLRAPGAAGGSTQQQFCPTAAAMPVLQPPNLRLQAEIFLRRFHRVCWVLCKVTKMSLVQ